MFSTHTDPYVAAAFWTGLGALGLTMLLGLQIVFMRMGLRRSERQEQRVLEKWRPLLNALVAGDALHDVPPLARADRMIFLKLWVHLQASLRGEANASLNELARRLDCDTWARALLKSGRRGEQLLAVLVLGHLRDAPARPLLVQHANAADSTLSLNAFWALMRIDPGAEAGQMTRLCISREDWALSRVVSILHEAREPCSTALVEALSDVDAIHLPRALRIAEALRINVPPVLLTRILHQPQVPVIVAALRSVLAPEVIDEVRAHLAHSEWGVRLQAARALGRIGDASDVARLQPLLQDSEWWVRYRTAQALAELPAFGPQRLAALRATVTDRFAADMLTQVMAEKGAA